MLACVKVACCLTDLLCKSMLDVDAGSAGIDGATQESLAAPIANCGTHGGRLLEQGDRKKNRRSVPEGADSQRPNVSGVWLAQTERCRLGRGWQLLVWWDG